MSTLKEATTIGRYRKFIVALATVAANALAIGLISGNAGKWVTVIITTLGALGVFQVPNDVTRADVTAKQPDSGAFDLVYLVAAALSIAGLIWLIIGFTKHQFDVFGLILLLVGLGIYFVFVNGSRRRTRL